MANNIYVVNEEASVGQTITITDDGGIDEIRITGVYPQLVSITLSWIWSGTTKQAAGTYYPNSAPNNAAGRLIVIGEIENARGSNGRDDIIGNALANIIYGDAAPSGAGGDDVVSAATGNDIVFGGSGKDTIGGGEGNDRLYGDDGADTISGNVGIDIIEGGGGADILSGGADKGDTVSYAGSNAAVIVNLTHGVATSGIGGHAAGDRIQGFDKVIGSAFADVIIDTVKQTIAFGYNDNSFSGGNGNDWLYLGGGNDIGFGGAGNDAIYGEAGNDRLDGGAGADHMTGGLGNDVFYVDNAADKVFEGAGQGTDTVLTAVNYALAAGQHIEVLATTALAGIGTVTLAGNEFAQRINGNNGANVLYGNGGNDTLLGYGGHDLLAGGLGNDRLDGGAGADRMTGGLGNDVFYVDNAADKVFEGAGQGTDTVLIAVNYALAAGQHVEVLATTAGIGAVTLAGNELAQRVNGNNGANVLYGNGGNDTLLGYGGHDLLAGGLGNDTLTGGAGIDYFVFNTALNPATNVDRITDFSAPQDTIRLDNVVMPGLGATLGTLAHAKFWKSTAGVAHDADDRIIYETDTGKLFYDANGVAAGGSVHFATLAANLALTNADFAVV